LVDAPIAGSTQQRLRLIDATGVWWHGRGVLATADGTQRLPIDWQLDGGALARGSIVVRIGRGDDAPIAGTLTLRSAGFDVANLRARMPASIVAALDPRLQTLTLGGSVNVDAPSLSAAGDRIAGDVDATWTRARVVAGDAVLDLGSVAMKSSAATNGWTSAVGNRGGNVTVTGTIDGGSGGTIGALDLRPAANASDAVRNALALLGPPDGSGGVHVAWRSAN
jgi:hypothetical protein